MSIENGQVEPKLSDLCQISTVVGGATKVAGARLSSLEARIRYIGPIKEAGKDDVETVWYGCEITGKSATGNCDGRFGNKGSNYYFKTMDGRQRGIFVRRENIVATGLQVLGPPRTKSPDYRNQELIDKIKQLYGEAVPASSLFADGAHVETEDNRKGTVQTSTQVDDPKKYQVVWYDEDGDMDFKWYEAKNLRLDADAGFSLTRDDVRAWKDMDVGQWTLALPEPHNRPKYASVLRKAGVNGNALIEMTQARVNDLFPEDHKTHRTALWGHVQLIQSLKSKN